jgi:hypothetical protein
MIYPQDLEYYDANWSPRVLSATFLVSRSINTQVLKTVQVFNIPKLQTILQNRFDRFAQRCMYTGLPLIYVSTTTNVVAEA